MADRFQDNVTPLDAATLNKFEDDMKQYAEDQCKEPASQNQFGSVKIWTSGSTLYISTK